MAKVRVRYQKQDTTFDYPSSTVSQDYSESEHDHGFLIWDIKDRDCWSKTFISTTGEKIGSEYSHFTFHGKSLDDLKSFDFSTLPRKVSFRPMFEDSLTEAEKQEVDRIIRQALPEATEVLPAIDAQIISSDSGSVFENVQLISNLNSYDAQIELIVSLLKKNEKMITDEQIAEIRAIHKELYQKLSAEGKLQKDLLKGWKLGKFEWSNLIQYGKNNVIDFSKLSGVVGIFGPNWVGKTSILRSLLWTLYNKIPDPHATGIHILNKHSNEASGNLSLMHGDKTYTIDRTMKKSSNKISGTLNFKVLEDGKPISKNEEVKTQTDKDAIQARFGDIDDLLLSSFASQWGHRQLIEMKQGERKDIINKFLGLHVYEMFHKIINPETNKIKAEVKKLLDKKLYEQIEMSEKQYTEHLGFVQRESKTLKKYEKLSQDQQSEIDGEKKRLEDIESKFDEEEFRKKAERYERVQSQINTETSKIKSLKTQIAQRQEELKKTKAVIPSLREVSEKAKADLDEFKNQIGETFGDKSLDDVIADIKQDIRKTKELVSLETKIRRAQSELEKMKESGGSFTKSQELYVGNESCVKCDFLYECLDIDKIDEPSISEERYHTIVDGLNHNIGKLETSLSELSEEYETTKSSIQYDESSLEAVQDLKESLRNLIDEESKSRTNHETAQSSLETIQSQIDSDTQSISDKKDLIESLKNEESEIEKYIDENSKYVDELEKIKEIQLSIDTLEEKKGETDVKHKMLLKEVNGNYDEAKKLEGKLEILRENLSEFEKLSQKLQVYEYYTSAVHKDGVPSEIVKLALPFVNSEVKRILSTFNLAFTAELEYDEVKQEINIYLSKDADKQDQNIIELASGAQQIICAMVLRIAFSNVSSVPSPNFFVIDEGFSALDGDNIQILPKLLEILKSYFKLVIIISHLDSVKEMVEKVIPISQYTQKDKGGVMRKYSQVHFQ
jgi:DNA repair exonuclease SbcCD ATPase subunit